MREKESEEEEEGQGNGREERDTGSLLLPYQYPSDHCRDAECINASERRRRGGEMLRARPRTDPAAASSTINSCGWEEIIAS